MCPRCSSLLLFFVCVVSAGTVDSQDSWGDPCGVSLLQRGVVRSVGGWRPQQSVPLRPQSVASAAEAGPPASVDLGTLRLRPPTEWLALLVTDVANTRRGLSRTSIMLLALSVVIVVGGIVAACLAVLRRVQARVGAAVRCMLLTELAGGGPACLEGFETSFEAMTVCMWRGIVNVSGFTVRRRGSEAAKPLLRVGRAHARLSGARMLVMQGSMADISHLLLTGVELFVEVAGTFQKTNLSEALECLRVRLESGGDDADVEEAEDQSVMLRRAVINGLNLRLAGKPDAPPFDGGRVELQPVELSKVVRGWNVLAPQFTAVVLCSVLSAGITQTGSLSWGSHAHRYITGEKTSKQGSKAGGECCLQ